MTRELSPDFVKLAAQTAIGQRLRAHYEASEELPSLFQSLIARMDECDAQAVAKRFPSKDSGH